MSSQDSTFQPQFPGLDLHRLGIAFKDAREGREPMSVVVGDHAEIQRAMRHAEKLMEREPSDYAGAILRFEEILGRNPHEMARRTVLWTMRRMYSEGDATLAPDLNKVHAVLVDLIKFGDDDALFELGELYHDAGRSEKARTLWKIGAEVRNRGCLISLVRCEYFTKEKERLKNLVTWLTDLQRYHRDEWGTILLAKLFIERLGRLHDGMKVLAMSLRGSNWGAVSMGILLAQGRFGTPDLAQSASCFKRVLELGPGEDEADKEAFAIANAGMNLLKFCTAFSAPEVEAPPVTAIGWETSPTMARFEAWAQVSKGVRLIDEVDQAEADPDPQVQERRRSNIRFATQFIESAQAKGASLAHVLEFFGTYYKCSFSGIPVPVKRRRMTVSSEEMAKTVFASAEIAVPPLKRLRK